MTEHTAAARPCSGSSSRQRLALAAALLALLLIRAATAGTLHIAVHQATDLGVATGPDGRLVIAVAGRLWSLPAEGGKAVAITPPGELARRPALSPDGRFLAWESLRQGAFQVMLAEADGTKPVELTHGPANNVSPAWAPDGLHVAVASDRGGDYSIWSIDVASRDAQQLTFDAADELDPAWHPDGSRIAYVSEQPGGRSALVVRRPFQQPRIVVSNGRSLRAPSWRPDGSVIVFASTGDEGTRLDMAILSEPSVVKPVTRNEMASALPVSWLGRDRLVYAADGMVRSREFGATTRSDVPFEADVELRAVARATSRRLPVASGAEAAVGLAGIAVLPDRHLVASALGDLWEFTESGELVRKLTDDGYSDRDPDASADGARIAFTSDRSGSTQIWTMDLATRALRQVTGDSAAGMHPAWSPGGERIAYLARAPGAGSSLEARVVDLATLAWRPLPIALDSPSTPAWSPDGQRVAFVRSEQGIARLLQVATDGSGGVRRATLPEAAIGRDITEARWSPDGRSLLLASSAGVRVLPVLGEGLVGADWRALSPAPAQIARWIPGEDAAVFTDAEGLARTSPGGNRRIALPVTWAPAPGAGRTVIRASRVLDVESGAYLLDRDVVIEGSRIVSVEPRSAVTDGAFVIDATGRTVMPGLIDLGLQITDVEGEALGRALLAWGITTAQALSGPTAELREVAERWRAHAAGPRLLASGEWCGAGPLPTPDDHPALGAGAVRLCAAAALTGLPAIHDASLPAWSPSWLAALAGGADAVGPYGLTRSEALYQDAVDAVVGSGTLLVTAIGWRVLSALIAQYPDLVDSAQAGILRLEPPSAEAGPDARAGLRNRERLLGRIAAGGGRIAPASASPLTPYGLGLHAELRLLAGSGLGRAQVLRMATLEAARALGLQDEIGAVAPGRLADLLIIDGDPLADLRDLQRLNAIVVEGRLRPFAELVRNPTPAAEKFTPVEPPASRKSRRRQH